MKVTLPPGPMAHVYDDVEAAFWAWHEAHHGGADPAEVERLHQRLLFEQEKSEAAVAAYLERHPPLRLPNGMLLNPFYKGDKA